MKPSFLIAGVGLALIAIFLLQYFLVDSDRRAPESSPIEVDMPIAEPAPLPDVLPNAASTTVATDPVPELPPLPSLDDSDPYVLELVADRLPVEWLSSEELVRRAATVLDNAARGTYPKRQLVFLAPAGDFPVTKHGDRFRLNPAGYARFTPFVDVVEGFGTDNLAAIYRRLEPLLALALAELGQRQTPDELLQQALVEILQTPQVSGDIALIRPGVLYKFRDPQLEARSALQKQLLRMGPANIDRLQSFAQQLAQLLTLTPITGDG